LVGACLNGFGKDCLFFFNYNRVNMKLGYSVMDSSIDEFFEPDRAATLRAEVATLSGSAREEKIVEAVMAALRDYGATPLAFRFARESGGTSHYLIFASKNETGIRIMKRLMAKASSEIRDGVGSFKYDPRDAIAPRLPFSGLAPVKDRMFEVFAGRTITLKDILAEEAPKTQYTESNYRDALLELERDGQIVVEPRAEDRPFQAGGEKRTLPEQTRITFPG
jgi:hypothetical protein